MRTGLDGKPRTLNIKRALDNLDFSQQGDKVRKENINNVKVLVDEGDLKIYHLITNDKLYYEVHRVEFRNRVEFETMDFFHIFMLVEGETVTVRTRNGYEAAFCFGETFIVPAAARWYQIVNENKGVCKLVKAFIKNTSF